MIHKIRNLSSQTIVISFTLLVVAGALIAFLFSTNNAFSNRLQNQVVRSLPGVSAIIEVAPPLYVSSVLGIQVPQGIAVNSDGSVLYVTEGDGERGVKIVDVFSQSLTGTLLPPGTQPGGRKPMSIAVNGDGVVYVVDRLRLVVDMYSPNGQWLGTLPDPFLIEGRWEPLGVGIDGQGQVYVTSSHPDGPFAAKYDSMGVLITTFGGTYELNGALAFPAGMAVGQDNLIYISDSNNGRVVVMDNDGRLIRSFGDQIGDESLGIPRGISVDSEGFLYVADVTSHVVKVWDTNTSPSTYMFSFGDGGIADGEFLYSNAVAIDGEGRIYVADTGNDRVQVWTY